MYTKYIYIYRLFCVQSKQEQLFLTAQFVKNEQMCTVSYYNSNVYKICHLFPYTLFFLVLEKSVTNVLSSLRSVTNWFIKRKKKRGGGQVEGEKKKTKPVAQNSYWGGFFKFHWKNFLLQDIQFQVTENKVHYILKDKSWLHWQQWYIFSLIWPGLRFKNWMGL